MHEIFHIRYRQLVFAKKRDRRNAMEDLKRMVQESEEQFQDDFQQRGPPSSSVVTASQPIANVKPDRFERFQDVEMEMDDELSEMPEVDRYLNEKFDLTKWKDADGNIN